MQYGGSRSSNLALVHDAALVLQLPDAVPQNHCGIEWVLYEQMHTVERGKNIGANALVGSPKELEALVSAAASSSYDDLHANARLKRTLGGPLVTIRSQRNLLHEAYRVAATHVCIATIKTRSNRDDAAYLQFY
jgi:hypothetical protein